MLAIHQQYALKLQNAVSKHGFCLYDCHKQSNHFCSTTIISFEACTASLVNAQVSCAIAHVLSNTPNGMQLEKQRQEASQLTSTALTKEESLKKLQVEVYRLSSSVSALR